MYPLELDLTTSISDVIFLNGLILLKRDISLKICTVYTSLQVQGKIFIDYF